MCVVVGGACVVAGGHTWLPGGMHGCRGACMVAEEACVMQGLSVPFACVGSGDPVRVLGLYTTNTLDTL